MSPTLMTSASSCGLAPLQEPAGPRDQFVHRERLHDVVVRAGFKSAQFVRLLATRRQHDDRQSLGLGLLPQAPAQLDPGQSGQHPVEYQQIRHAFLEARLGFVAVHDRFDRIAGGYEVVAQELDQRHVVFDDHQA